MSGKLKTSMLVVAIMLAAFPLVDIVLGHPLSWMTPRFVAGLNLLGWSFLVALLVSREDLHRKAREISAEFGIDSRFKSLEELLEEMFREILRKDSALSLNLLERRISSHDELSRALERIVNVAYKLLDAESAEIALFDKESGMYHSSFVLGKPFRVSAQAMLSGAVEGDRVEEVSPDVLIQPLAFAGAVLGSLRVGLKKGRIPTTVDQEIMSLLAIQAGLAMINANYTEELLRMKHQADESVKAKTGFLANLSHEIRGPLGIMLNAVELVLDGLCGEVNKEQSETLRMIQTNGQHLLDLINDVLDYAKIEAGKVRAEPVEIVVNDLLQDMCNVVRTQAEAKQHKIVFKPSVDVLAMSVDRRHIRQMLINLLSNAIKYTPNGGTIEVWAERAPGNKVKINVKDSGVGIEESERSKVFTAFERVEHSYSIKQVGTGLGMPLTKRLAEMNGGSIDFTSSSGKGSHFWLVFPRVTYDVTAKGEEVVEEAAVQGNGDAVMIVQAGAEERGMLVKYLNDVGFKVIEADSFDAALDVVRRQPVKLVVLDDDLFEHPDAAVIQALRKSNDPTQPLPVLLLSSRAFVFDIETYLKSGVDRCLSKPLQLKELARSCRNLIDTGGGSLEPSKSASPRLKSKTILIDDLLH
ncbi:MAG: hybrid sensor histidine kinase/response regulator [Bdellovibrionota bacterium]|nr:MAG: hybrid sensor histidine kinase/response regulator [Bdellovibrionota bacterium]